MIIDKLSIEIKKLQNQLEDNNKLYQLNESLNLRRLIEQFFRKIEEQINIKGPKNILDFLNLNYNHYGLEKNDLSVISYEKQESNRSIHGFSYEQIANSVMSLKRNKETFSRLFKATFSIEPEELI